MSVEQRVRSNIRKNASARRRWRDCLAEQAEAGAGPFSANRRFPEGIRLREAEARMNIAAGEMAASDSAARRAILRLAAEHGIPKDGEPVGVELGGVVYAVIVSAHSSREEPELVAIPRDRIVHLGGEDA